MTVVRADRTAAAPVVRPGRAARAPVHTILLALHTTLLASWLIALGAATPVAAQSNYGTTGAAVLQLPAGSRAAAMGGAYTAAADGDAIFYNPAAAVWLAASASLAYQRHVDEIGFGTVGATRAFRPVAVALTFGFLDYGTIAEIVPDPAFGGQRGEETGLSASAAEVVGRITLAAPLLRRRLAAGVSAGLLWVSVAETGRIAAVFDAGLQYRAGHGLAFGAALRNAGGPLEGARLGPLDLPTEVRGGVSYLAPPLAGPVSVTIHADLVAPVNDGPTALAAGAEAAIVTRPDGLSAALRAGYNGTVGPAGVGPLHLGAGITRAEFSLDYVFQDMGVLGAVHRFGVRWSR
ncbi:hypothetical protein BH23GEM9_BH23GEM9_01110 [soil metagenome]